MPKRIISEEARKRKNEKTAERYRNNKEKYSQYHKELRERKKLEDPDFQKKEAERAKNWRTNNLEKSKESAKKSREKHAEKRKKETREWFKKNSDKRVFYQNKRKASVINRTPKWADLKMIEYFYSYAKMLTACTNISHVVDHVIPLQGKNVSGLNVHNNLIVIKRNINQIKYNKENFDFSNYELQEKITTEQAVNYLYPEIVRKINDFLAERGVKIPVSKREAEMYGD